MFLLAVQERESADEKSTMVVTQTAIITTIKTTTTASVSFIDEPCS